MFHQMLLQMSKCVDMLSKLGSHYCIEVYIAVNDHSLQSCTPWETQHFGPVRVYMCAGLNPQSGSLSNLTHTTLAFSCSVSNLISHNNYGMKGHHGTSYWSTAFTSSSE